MKRLALPLSTGFVAGFTGASLAHLTVGQQEAFYMDISAWLAWFGIALMLLLGLQLAVVLVVVRGQRS